MQDAFHVPDGYFLSHSVGCLPRTVEAELSDAFLSPWETGTNWDKWMGTVETFRAGIARFLGVDAGSICPQATVSSALTKIIHSLPFDPDRNVILLSRRDFPTIGFVLKQAEKRGYRLQFVDGDPMDLSQWDRHLGPQTAIVHITHALSETSHLLPVEPLCARARAIGAISVVDVAQSLIAVPTSVQRWGADFVTGTSVKFLCGGPGACFLYVRLDRLDMCKPLDVGWFSHENPFEMNIADFRYAPDAMRFFGGTPSPAPLICASAAMAVWDDLDLAAVQSRIQTGLSHLLAATPDAWCVSPSDPDTRGATYAISPDNPDHFETSAKEAGLMFDRRASGFRFSLHGYTLDRDIERLRDVVSAHHA